MTAVIDCGIMANRREQPPICYAHIRLLKTNFESDPKNGGKTLMPRSVYPYYYLSRMSPPSEAQHLIDNALSNVKKVITEQDCQKRFIDELISYDSFVNENILGIEMSSVNYRRMQEYKKLLSCNSKFDTF